MPYNHRQPGWTIPITDVPGQYDLLILCGCGHRATMRHRLALDLVDAGTTCRELIRALLCSKCGRRGGHDLHLRHGRGTKKGHWGRV